MVKFEPCRAFGHLDKLAYEIGPRPAGTRSEELAADRIRREFESYGLRVKIQRFEFADRNSRARATASLMGAAFISSLFIQPLASLLIWSTALIAWRLLGKLMPKRRSQNIVATLGPGKSRAQVAITAHYDSSPYVMGRKLHIILRLTFLPLVLALTVLLIARAAGLLGGWGPIWGASAALLLPICAGMFMAAGRGASPGANDNASGVAVMLEVARVLARAPPRDVRATFAALGAEEHGLVGAQAR